MLKVCAVGGYDDVGKNMTAVMYGDEAVILDMGLHMESYINYDIEDEIEYLNCDSMRCAGVIPDDSRIASWAGKVKAIVVSHAHLDHIGAIPFLAAKYDAEIILTPFSANVLNAITSEKDLHIPNHVRVMKLNTTYKISKNLKVEFIGVTHSTPDTAIIVIHTPEGSIMYANDFKFDNSPTLGAKPNYKRLKELGRSGKVELLIEESLYSARMGKTPSEKVAKEMLREVLLETNTKGRALIVTTFSSHIARLKAIKELGEKLRRRTIFLGRSLAKYVYAAEEAGIAKFSDKVSICGFPSQIKKALREVEKQGRDRYLLAVTGHQGEPDAVLSRIVNGKLDFRLYREDYIVFSCGVIPSPTNVENRKNLEDSLMSRKVRIFKDVHASGHASREDHRDFIEMVRPRHIMPSHAGKEKALALCELAEEIGYVRGRNIHLMHDGKTIEL